MTTSTDAILFYGICVDPEEIEIIWEINDIDVSRYYAEKMGIVYPAVEYDKNDSLIVKAYKDFWEEEKEVNKQSKCQVVTHCSYDYPMYGIAIEETIKMAYRGDPVEITKLKTQKGYDSLLKDFCKNIDIKYEQPKWWLVSMWG